jgi:hypothetical protein
MFAGSKALELRMAVAAALIGLAAALSAQTPQWKTYSYPADGFSVSLPSEPAIEKQNVDTDAGVVELHTYLADDDPGGMMIGVGSFGAAAAGKDPDVLLQGGKNGALENTRTHLLREKKIALGDNHGLEFEAENDALHATVRIFLVGTTLYQVIVAYPVHKPYADTTRFLDSFQLIPKAGK